MVKYKEVNEDALAVYIHIMMDHPDYNIILDYKKFLWKSNKLNKIEGEVYQGVRNATKNNITTYQPKQNLSLDNLKNITKELTSRIKGSAFSFFKQDGNWIFLKANSFLEGNLSVKQSNMLKEIVNKNFIINKEYKFFDKDFDDVIHVFTCLNIQNKGTYFELTSSETGIFKAKIIM